MPNAYRLQELADLLDAELSGDPDHLITGLGTLEAGLSDQLSFLANNNYQKYLPATRAGAVLLKSDQAEQCPSHSLIVDNPYVAFAKASQLFDPMAESTPGIHPSAIVHPSVSIGDGVTIDAGVVIEAGVVIGASSVIGANSVIGRDSQLGDGCRLYPNVTLYHGVTLGTQVTIHSSAVIGGDGFGFANENGEWVKIAQLGSVIIGDHVEIGANTNIDRGALDDTTIGNQVIIDSQVQIAHNVKIGDGTAIAGCVGIAGSTSIGRYCLIGGAVSIAGHISICDGVTITMGSVVMGSLSQKGTFSSGTAVMANKQWRKNAVRFSQLDQLARSVRRLEKKAGQAKTSE